MPKQAVEAVFEDGAFKPLKPLKPALAEGQHVRLLVEELNAEESLLDLATHVYEGLAPEQIDEIETIALDRSNFLTEREKS